MPAEWEATTLGAEVDLLTGFPFKSERYTEAADGVRLVRGDNIVQGAMRWDGVKRWPASSSPEHELFQLRRGDVVLAMDRPWIDAGLKYAAISGFDLPCLLVQRTARLRGGPRIDNGFLRYLIGSPEFTQHIHAITTGTAVPHISGRQIRDFAFARPPLPEQRAIASVLGALDDKIDLNRRMCQTLEEMARALFKSWFVDFDPVRAKMEGRDPGLPKEIADLFPSRLVDSELGPIPEGWTSTSLGEVVACLETGNRPRGGVAGITAGVPSIGAESIVGLGHFDFSKTRYVPRDFYAAMKRGRLESRDVLLYKDGGRPGEFEPHVTLFGDGFPFSESCINEHVYRIRVAAPATQNYLYFWLSSDLAMAEMRMRGTGVAIPGLNSSQARALQFLLPTEAALRAFEALAEPVTSRVLAAASESRRLQDVRDTLLPKLISGEIRVPASLGSMQEVVG